MTEPMNDAEIAVMVADMQAGTPGPWTVGTLRTKNGWRCFIDAALWGKLAQVVVRMKGDADECRDGLANARRIARVPAMEQTILALQSQLAAMTEARDAALARVVTPQEAATVLLDWWNQDATEAGSIAIEARKVVAVTTALKDHEGDPWSQFNAAMKTLAEGTPT